MFCKFISQEISYLDALKEQEKLTLEKKKGWLLFVCKSTVTLGLRANVKESLLAPESLIKEHGIEILKLNRGGFATFHGPGQIVGFPVGKVEDFTGDPRGVRIFVEKLLTTLCDFVAEKRKEEVTDCKPGSPSGVWIKSEENYRKVAALGMSFHHSGIQHGFALNIYPHDRGTLWGFGTIVPCGEKDAVPAFVFDQEIEDKIFKQTVEELSERLKTL